MGPIGDIFNAKQKNCDCPVLANGGASPNLSGKG